MAHLDPVDRLDTAGDSTGSLSALLRAVGGGALLLSIGSFLFQRWDTGTDLYRFGMLLALTAGLITLGFASGRWLQEGKGARLFVSIALAAVPANFAVLGAFVYQHWAWDRAATSYPGVAQWQIPPSASIGLLMVSALAVLLPMTWLGFMVLARKAALRLSTVFLLANGVLLLPVRESGWIALLFAAIGVLCLWQVDLLSRRDASLATSEGRWARGMLFIPHVILLGRAAWLYSPDAVLGLVVIVGLFIMLRQLSLRLSGLMREVLELVSVLPALAAGSAAWSMLMPHLDEAALNAFAAAVSAGLLFELSIRAVVFASGYRRLAALTLAVPLVAGLVLFDGLAAAFLCLLGGLVLMLGGYWLRHGFVLATGALMLLLGLASQTEHLLQHFDLLGWGSLAGIGVAAILVGSIIDRFGSRLRGRWQTVRQELGDWTW